MSEPVWLEIGLVTVIQAEQLAIFGGASGIRDLTLLESALDRPRNKFAYGETDFNVLAAAYAFGIARNHPFVDGNKRTSLLAIYTFLGLNDIELDADEADAAAVIEAMAAGNLSEAELAAWIGMHVG
jgi:death on curing protein